MSVRSAMNPAPQFARSDASAADVAKIMESGSCGAVPIVNRDMRPIGIVTDRDICLGLARRGKIASEVAVTELMSKRLYACLPDEPLANALRTMREKKIRRLLVVERRGMLIGILTMEDIVRQSGSDRVGVGYQETIDALKTICSRAIPAAASGPELVARA